VIINYLITVTMVFSHPS